MYAPFMRLTRLNARRRVVNPRAGPLLLSAPLARAAPVRSRLRPVSSPNRRAEIAAVRTSATNRGTAGHKALDVMRGPGHPIVDVIELLNGDDQARLRGYAEYGLPRQVGE